MTSDQPATARLTRWLADNQSSLLAFGVFVVVVGVFELGPLLGARLGLSLLDFPMPAAFDSRAARIILLFFVLIYAVIAVAAALKALETRAMRSWIETDAKIVRSQPGFRLIKPAKGMPRNHRIADIGYAYEVRSFDGGPKTVFGSRIRIDEVIPEEEVDALLTRYPIGAKVRIFVDPHDPDRSALEREADSGRTAKGLIALAVVFAILALPIMCLATHGATSLRTIPLSRWGWVVLVSGLMATGFFWAEIKQRRWLAGLRDWPTVKGVVVSSSVEAFDSGHRNHWSNGQVREFVTSYMPVVEYRYELSGVSFLSRNIQADMTIAGSERYAQGYVDRYAPGTKVEVAYDPANPARAAIEPTHGFGWTFRIAGSAFGIVAIVTALKVWG